MGELPRLRRDSIRQIFRSAEAGYNATLVPTVLGLGAPRRTHVGYSRVRPSASCVMSISRGCSHRLADTVSVRGSPDRAEDTDRASDVEGDAYPSHRPQGNVTTYKVGA